MSVSTAKGGEEALEKIRKAKPDAIVLDLMMPGLDGFDVMEALRQVERTRQIPVLVLTAKDLTHEERGRLDLGRTRFLTKSYASQQAILDDLSQLLDRELRDQLKELPSPDGG
jgi:CheY-like chemotaxis protein